ncbi:MAG: hypothetical protein WGN25_14810 [Candidatus Electrothrix sp. GW3-4]|uniref:hypothetical protein n=1 Tax=Candidatus Electrothrix sp. GW3-4 TaxID=3126740 RepID=UPI0030CD7D54
MENSFFPSCPADYCRDCTGLEGPSAGPNPARPGALPPDPSVPAEKNSARPHPAGELAGHPAGHGAAGPELAASGN